jgi:hypothetical protein
MMDPCVLHEQLPGRVARENASDLTAGLRNQRSWYKWLVKG